MANDEIDCKIVGKDTMPKSSYHWLAHIRELAPSLKDGLALRFIIPKKHSHHSLFGAWWRYCNNEIHKKPKSKQISTGNGSMIVWLWFEELK